MKIKHQSGGALQTLAGPSRQLHLRGALALQARTGGWLHVQTGVVWLTRDGDPADHVLAAGDGLHLRPGQRAVVEPWWAGQPAGLAWAAGAGPLVDKAVGKPAGHPAGRPAGTQALAGALWRGLAAVLRAAAGRLAAAARSADARARRAQGSIAAGDSVASSGALQ